MTNTHLDTDKVLASNEGDEFHIVWTARRCLKLLNPRNDLKAVIVEGVAPEDKTSRGGILKADTTEYYGGDTFEDAVRFVMYQLKYSASEREKDKVWTASGLKDTISAFAEDFDKKCTDYGEEFVKDKAKYLFVTNRPIAESVLEALDTSIENQTTHSKKAYKSIKDASGLTDDRFNQFLSLFEFQAREKDRPTQEWEFHNELSGYLSADDSTAPLKIEKLIRRKTLLTGDKKPIRINDVLRELDISSVERLLPAEPSENYLLPENYVPRTQEPQIAQTIIQSKQPVIIHAPGGVGKSALALRLPSLMPKGSQSVVFDGFADALYRQASTPRHEHREGLVQITNELAFQGLCDPLLPSQLAKRSDYLRAFRHRLRQAIETVKRDAPNALILIVLDAADNSQQAANNDPTNTPSFCWDLLRETLPEHCRLVLLARTERYEELLSPPSSTELIELKSFNIDETTSLLRSFYPAVDEKSVKEFYRMTSANPRVQFNALKGSQNFNDMMKALGSTPLSVDDTISLQLEQSLKKVREDAVSENQIDRLCTALAILPPLVPVSILARAASINEALVYSFVSDIGHYLFERDGAVHFRDEPVDTWFRENFSKPDNYDDLISSLTSIANNSYVSLALPEILWQAGKIDALMNLATSEDDLPDDNPVERRRIILRRAQFSLRAAIKTKRYADIVKLSMRVGQEVAGNNREAALLLENHDLVCTLMGAKRAQEIVFRHHTDNWLGASYAYGASILANDPAFMGEARHMLRIADGWLSDWSELPKEEREKQPIEDDDIAAFQNAHLLIHGPKRMVSELLRWSPKLVSLRIGIDIIRRLVDLGKFDLVNEISDSSDKNPYIVLAVTQELGKVGRITSKHTTHEAIKYLLREEKIEWVEHHWKNNNKALEAVISLAESGAQNNVPARTLIRLLNKYIPEIPNHGYADHHHDDRDVILRFYCLKASLQKKDLSLEDVAQDDIKKTMKSKNSEHSSDLREFKEVIGVLLPWYKLRAKVISKSLSGSLPDEISKVRENIKGSWGYRENRSYVANEVAEIWLNALVRNKNTTKQEIVELVSWIQNKDAFFYYPTRISIARTIASSSQAKDEAYGILKKVYEECILDRETAYSRTETLTSISRAILSLNKKEATEYFSKALDVVNRFGDEIYYSWEAFSVLAESASDPHTNNPELAYRYVRVAEVMSEYIDKFPWRQVITRASMLCPYSGFALLSRLSDRDKGWFKEMLASLSMSLNHRNLLPISICAALTSFGRDWSKHKILEKALSEDKATGTTIFNQFVFDACLVSDTTELEDFVSLSKKYNIKNTALDNLYNFLQMTKRDRSNGIDLSGGIEREEKTVDWEDIIDGYSFLTFSDIDAAYQKLEAPKPFWPFKDLLEKMRAQIPDGKEAEHIEAIVNSKNMSTYDISAALQAIADAWQNKLSVKKDLQRAVEIFLKNRSSEFLTSTYALDSKLNELGALSNLPQITLIEHLLKGVSESLDNVESSGFFVLAHKLTDLLNTQDSIDALEYALVSLEYEVDEDDGDGEWNEKLRPSNNIYETVAGFLYVSLAHPKAEIRWEAAHAVLRLCRFEQEEVLDSLIRFLDSTSLYPYTDSKLPFYYWHSRLFLMIALARAAKEKPDLLLKYKDTFLKWALEEPKHLLIRHFAAQALLFIQEYSSGTLNNDKLEQIQNINASKFPRIKKETANDTNLNSSNEIEDEEQDCILPYDFETSWIQPLCRVFGFSKEDASKEIKKWVLKESDRRPLKKWSDDPRASRRYYYSLDTMCKDGSQPEADPLSFYLCYHALFHLAAHLIDNKPTLISEGWGDGWDDWMKRHMLTRNDGYWLSDRRDPPPLELRRWQKAVQDSDHYKDWKWSVLPSDFDDALISQNNKIVLYGHWNISNGSQREEISVRSAAISPENSMFLLRSLQTIDNSYDFYIPTSGHDSEINKFGFQMHGWVFDPYTEWGLDELDRLSGKNPWPSLAPSKRTCRFLDLEPSPDGRIWYHEDLDVVQSEAWGDRKEDKYRHSKASDYGQRLVVNIDFAIKALQKLERDLIIEVRIGRDDGKEESYYGHRHDNRDYNRIYVLRQNGELCTLHRSTFIWEKDSSGVKKAG